ncbi:MAG TPA: hypothetical protein DHV42_00985 [Lachnospiraceae bacterium]|nr:hypothetical protein [Lachnospiraceae bacterium]
MRRMIAISIFSILALVIGSFIVLYRYREKAIQSQQMTEKTSSLQSETQKEALQPQTQPPAPAPPQTETPQTEDPALHAEDGIYSFLQGPVAWESKAPWSGIWCESELDGGLFSVFGCGLCDLASIYSTLSPYECSPLDMYALARKVTDYAPGDGAGAIDWPYMVDALQKTGFTAQLREKDKTYEAFQKAVTDIPGAIVLISSEEDDTYWQDTPGHYVNIWHYNPETDQVFIGDSGNPKHNRQWIPLRYIYDALASDSAWQYMLITSYEEDKNTWKYSGIHEKWTRPAYYKAKPESKSLLMPAQE